MNAIYNYFVRTHQHRMHIVYQRHHTNEESEGMPQHKRITDYSVSIAKDQTILQTEVVIFSSMDLPFERVQYTHHRCAASPGQP